MNTEMVMDAIQECADEWLKEPRIGLPRGYFERRSTEKWAVGEILRYIENSSLPPTDAIKEFSSKMSSAAAASIKHKVIFGIARDMAEEVLDMLNAML